MELIYLERDSFNQNTVAVQPHPNYGASPTKTVVSVLIEGIGVGKSTL